MSQQEHTPAEIRNYFGIADVSHGADLIYETPTPRSVPSVVPAYTGVTPALDAAVGAVDPPLNQPYIPPYDVEAPWPGDIKPIKLEPELVRKFDTGATRSADAGRYDPEGFLSPLVIDRYCQYMSKNRLQPDGTVRDSDNWQKGIPLATYMKGLWRHMHHAWTRHRGFTVDDPKAAADIEEDLCAVIFNASGYLHELLVKHRNTRLNPVPAVENHHA